MWLFLLRQRSAALMFQPMAPPCEFLPYICCSCFRVSRIPSPTLLHSYTSPATIWPSIPHSLTPRRIRNRPPSPQEGFQLFATSQKSSPLSASVPHPMIFTAWPPMYEPDGTHAHAIVHRPSWIVNYWPSTTNYEQNSCQSWTIDRYIINYHIPVSITVSFIKCITSHESWNINHRYRLPGTNHLSSNYQLSVINYQL